MNSLVFVTNMDFGGVAAYSVRCKEMLKQNYENVYLGTFENSREAEVDLLLDKGSTIAKLKVLRSFIKEKKIETVIANIDMAPIWIKLATLFLNIKIISVVHTRLELYNLSNKKSIKNCIFKKLLLGSFLISNRLIAVSEGLKEEIIDTYRFTERKLYTIYNPIINKEFFEDSEIKDVAISVLEKENYIDIENKKTINLISVGWISDIKNQMKILEVLKLLKGENGRNVEYINKDYKLTLVGGIGDSEYHKKIQKYIKDNDLSENVIFTGEIKNVKTYLENADIYVLSSKTEALSIALIEAIEVSLPIVANDCKYGPREILKDRYGLLYDGSANDLKAKILEIQNNKTYNQLKDISHKRARDFSYRTILNDYIEILEN